MNKLADATDKLEGQSKRLSKEEVEKLQKSKANESKKNEDKLINKAA